MVEVLIALLLLATGVFLLMGFVVFTIIRSSQEKPINMKALALQGLLVIGMMVGGGLLFMKAVVSSGKTQVQRMQQVQGPKLPIPSQVASDTIAVGTTAIGEGFGKTAAYFEKKWKQENLEQIRLVSFALLPGEKEGLQVQIENRNETPVDLNNFIRRQLLLVEDAEGNVFPFKALSEVNGLHLVPAGAKTMRVLEPAVKLSGRVAGLVSAE